MHNVCNIHQINTSMSSTNSNFVNKQHVVIKNFFKLHLEQGDPIQPIHIIAVYLKTLFKGTLAACVCSHVFA